MKPTPEKYIRWLDEGKSYEDIKKDLLAANKSEDEIKEWMDLIHRMTIRQTVQKESKKTYLTMFIVGSILFLSGLYTVITSDELWGVIRLKVFYQGLLLSVIAGFMMVGGIKYFKEN